MESRKLTLDAVKQYYGTVLSSSKDLKTSACCTVETLPAIVFETLSSIHPEVKEKFYGCGAPFPSELANCTVVDLGCGSGRDSYLLSKLVGAKGQVIGVDMTSEQLEVANRHIDFHRQNFGFQKSNVTFKQGYIEDLSSAGIASNSVDVVVSNCVVNLSPDKESVFREVYRILKPGGEFYFSDVYANKRVPKHLLDDNTLLGECLAGALYTEDFRRLMYKAGFYDPRIVTKSQIALTDPVIARKIGMIDFQSITYRCFKIPELEDRCEDYGQVAYYLGSIENMPHSFALDDHHLFQTGKPHLVCSNTAFMLSHTRYSKHFRVEGDLSTHFGLFDCATPSVTTSSTSGACC